MIKKEWGKALQNICPYLLFSVAIFFVFALTGIFFTKLYPLVAKEAFKELSVMFSPLMELGPFELGLFIFFNNAFKIFLFIFLGVFFALPTIFFVALNGWVLGYVSALMYPEIGADGLFFSLFFHGIFELTALFIGAAMGIRIGVLSYQGLKKRKEERRLSFGSLFPVIRKPFLQAITVFLWLILPLLFIAAIIETILIFFI